MPVFGGVRNGNDITRPDFLNGTTPELNASRARCDDERLPVGMAVPGRAGAGFEGDLAAGDARMIVGSEQTRYSDISSESVAGPLGNEACGFPENHCAWG